MVCTHQGSLNNSEIQGLKMADLQLRTGVLKMADLQLRTGVLKDGRPAAAYWCAAGYMYQQIPKLTDGYTQGLRSKGENAIGVIIFCDCEVH